MIGDLPPHNIRHCPVATGSPFWCPWPLKCMVTKQPITGKEWKTCVCMNCVLWNTGTPK